MDIRHLGKSDLAVPLLGLGCNNFGWRVDAAAAADILSAALDLGVTFLDTAPSYAPSEEFIGAALGARRKDFVLATKFGLNAQKQRTGASAGHIKISVHESLTRLRTDVIDLLQVHFPDPDTPIDETLRALEDLLREGKVRAIGCSNFTAPMLEDADAAARVAGLTGFASLQSEYNLLERGIEQDIVPAAVARGLALIPYFPLANGLLTGKYRTGAPAPETTRLADAPSAFDAYRDPRKWDLAERLATFASERGHTLLELAFAWLASRPQVATIIAGATSVDQLRQNAYSIGWMLSGDDLDEVDRITGASVRP